MADQIVSRLTCMLLSVFTSSLRFHFPYPPVQKLSIKTPRSDSDVTRVKSFSTARNPCRRSDLAQAHSEPHRAKSQPLQLAVFVSFLGGLLFYSIERTTDSERTLHGIEIELRLQLLSKSSDQAECSVSPAGLTSSGSQPPPFARSAGISLTSWLRMGIWIAKRWSSSIKAAARVSERCHRGEQDRGLKTPTSFSMKISLPNGFESFCRRSRMAFAFGAQASLGIPRLANLSE